MWGVAGAAAVTAAISLAIPRAPARERPAAASWHVAPSAGGLAVGARF
jgi:hypothetical protein